MVRRTNHDASKVHRYHALKTGPDTNATWSWLLPPR